MKEIKTFAEQFSYSSPIILGEKIEEFIKRKKVSDPNYNYKSFHILSTENGTVRLNGTETQIQKSIIIFEFEVETF